MEDQNTTEKKVLLPQKLLKSDLDQKVILKEILLLDSLGTSINRPLESLTKLNILTYDSFKQLVNSNHEDEKCSICICEFSASDSHNIIKLDKCSGHYFHKDCIELCHKQAHLRCPICGIIYGIMTGDMPRGSMSLIKYPSSAVAWEAYPNTDILEIHYIFKSGKKDDILYPGTTRVAYLPNNDEGIEVLRLLIIAFERRLTFTIGTSVTTGRANQVVWNGIHHKTALEGGPSCFGYPDETYFSRVKEELAAKGIF